MYKMVNCQTILDEMCGGDSNNLHYVLIHKLENAVDEQSNSAFDYAYSLIDTACKTILVQRKESIHSNNNLPKRFGCGYFRLEHQATIVKAKGSGESSLA
jgi:hypothetical protein